MISTVGGRFVFLNNFISQLDLKEYDVVWDPSLSNKKANILLLSSGTRRLLKLIILKKKCLIVQRLDRWYDDSHYSQSFASRLRNYMSTISTNIIRLYLSDVAIYQSFSVKNKWEETWGPKKNGKSVVIYNGTDIEKFYPLKNNHLGSKVKILFVEGDYYMNDVTYSILKYLENYPSLYKVTVAGKAPEKLISCFHNSNVYFSGPVPHAEIPELYRSHDIYISLEKDAPCPNAVIEAMSSGLPVVGFNWGAMPELVNKNSGIIIPTSQEGYFDPDSLYKLSDAVKTIKNNYLFYSNNARIHVEKEFDIKSICQKYLECLKITN